MNKNTGSIIVKMLDHFNPNEKSTLKLKIDYTAFLHFFLSVRCNWPLNSILLAPKGRNQKLKNTAKFVP